jgi:hypothetical protein
VSGLRRLYRRWLVFAWRLNRLVVGTLFGLIYFAVVPLFLFLQLGDRLGARAAEDQISFWKPRGAGQETLEDLSRMG